MQTEIQKATRLFLFLKKKKLKKKEVNLYEIKRKSNKAFFRRIGIRLTTSKKKGPKEYLLICIWPHQNRVRCYLPGETISLSDDESSDGGKSMSKAFSEKWNDLPKSLRDCLIFNMNLIY